MSVTSVDTDYDRLTITMVADFDAPVERVWELWADPRKAERWWGPPGYPATFVKHEMTAGAETTYFMTDAEGERYGGMWRITAVDPPASLEFDALFADPDGKQLADMPVSKVTVRFMETDRGTRMEIVKRFESREGLDLWLSTGSREGQTAALAQMDALLTWGG